MPWTIWKIIWKRIPENSSDLRTCTGEQQLYLFQCIFLKQTTMNNNQPQSQSGSGSAENKDLSRSEQLNRRIDDTSRDKEEVASQIGEATSHIAGLKDMGAMSGRDDAAGGSGDRMEDEHTTGRTER
jgi:hypothetical protein